VTVVDIISTPTNNSFTWSGCNVQGDITDKEIAGAP